MKIKNLLINQRYQPLGVDCDPNVSWQLESELPQTKQIAYQIVLRSQGRVVSDTGKVESCDNSFLSFGSVEWQSLTAYQVEVSVWANHQQKAVAATTFETSLLDNQAWQGAWMAAPRTPVERQKGFGKQPPASLFRQDVTLKDQPIKQARLLATALGAYQLTVNGKRPDNRELAPEPSAYRRWLNFQEYDVTALLHQGLNTVGMHVGDGWYCGVQTMPPIKDLHPDHAVLFELIVEYADHTKQVLGSDETMQWHESPVRSADLYAGGQYDANFELPGWDLPQNDTQDWQLAKPSSYPFENLHPQADDPIRPFKEIEPQSLLKAPNGDMIIDFGQVMAGWLKVAIDEPKGTAVSFEHTEVLDQEGNYYINTQSALGVTEQKDVYVSNGTPTVFEPHFTYHGFRYVRVKGMSSIDLKNFKAIVLSSTGRSLGSFETSNKDLNQLYHNVLWSQIGNFFGIPTDCPQREKAGWTGDVWIYGQTALENANETPLLTQWLHNLKADQDANGNGIVTFTVPDTAQYHDSGVGMGQQMGCNGIVNSAGWGDVAVHLPMVMYQTTGNRQILEQQYDSMRDWTDYVIRQARIRRPGSQLPDKIEQHLWNTGFQFGEWLIPSQAKEEGQDLQLKLKNMAASASYTAPLFGWKTVSEMAQTADVLGRIGDAAKYHAEADLMKWAIQNGGVIDENGEMPSKLMGAYVLPIAFDLVPERFMNKFKHNLEQSIADHDGCLDTGFLATPFLLAALCRINRRDLAYQLLFQTKTPSWLAEVKHGATTIWESWISYDENNHPLPTSFNHYAYGVVADWMYHEIGGISQAPDSIGYQHLIFKPSVGYGIDWAKREYETSQGLAKCAWEVNDGIFRIAVDIPANSRGTVIMPDGRRLELGSGHYEYDSQLNH